MKIDILQNSSIFVITLGSSISHIFLSNIKINILGTNESELPAVC